MSSPKPQLRSPDLSDLSHLADLGRDTFVETFGDLYKPEDLNSFLENVYSEHAIAEELQNPELTYQVLSFGGELIGYAKIGKLHLPVDHLAPHAMEIWQLYLRKPFIGQGFGAQLMNWAMAQFALRGTSEIYVSVFSENLRAIQFYQKFGFEKVGEYGFPVGDQIDIEWIMRAKQ